jgi:serine/threonine protein kinase
MRSPLHTRALTQRPRQAVSCMHAQHHFHRDLKPENVMFDASYNIKVRC